MKKAKIALIVCLILVLNFFAGCASSGLSADISDYTIVIPQNATDYEQNAANYIKDMVLKQTGAELSVIKDTNKQKRNEILVGDTSRELSQDTAKTKTKGLQFVINSDKKAIALSGDHFIIAGAAYYFVEEYITDSGIDINLPKTATVLMPTPKKANNYFFLIGDGMGVNQTKLIEYNDTTVSKFSDKEEMFHGYLLPNQGKINTNSRNGTTDSAAAATALATGVRTTNGRVGRDPDGNDVKSLTELAVELGFKTAVMSTEVSTGATPAGFSAHADDRNDTAVITACQDAMTQTDINCGFNDLTWAELEKTVRKQLKDLENDKGIFLMYEEAYIDKASHGNDMDSTFYMVMRFDQIIGVFMEYALYNPDTMVIITADHETGGLTLNDNNTFEYTTTTHTSDDVAIFAYGEQTEFFNGKKMRNNNIPKFIANLWGVQNFGE